MKWIWLLTTALLLAGCDVGPTRPAVGGEAPTGVAPGVTLYFVDASSRLQSDLRPTGRLGTISEAVDLLLSGPGGSGLHTEIAPHSVTRVIVRDESGLIELLVPLTVYDVTPLGIDQLVCTALGVRVQSGGPRTTKVRIRFTQPTPESEVHRTCPLII